ncbi:hypothetical protein ACH5RR_021950 [Cinchona calisaya]|uniref:Kinesin motor domain-containing protein n=1 Tax=Cinchona calisaya TaxID=153742 RepID=A0ABD2Z7H9_9GENT
MATTIAGIVEELACIIKLTSHSSSDIFECRKAVTGSMLPDPVTNFKAPKDRSKGEILHSKLTFKKTSFQEWDEAITDPMFLQLSYIELQHDYILGNHPAGKDDAAQLCALQILVEVGYLDGLESWMETKFVFLFKHTDDVMLCRSSDSLSAVDGSLASTPGIHDKFGQNFSRAVEESQKKANQKLCSIGACNVPVLAFLEMKKLQKNLRLQRLEPPNWKRNMKGKIRAYCRLRPLCEKEIANKERNVVTCVDRFTVEYLWKEEIKQPVYHQVFDGFETQKDVFENYRLSFADLTGCERVKNSAACRSQLKEPWSINKSLSALGDVISALSCGRQHIPYRNHKLTMLMSDSLGGNSKTLMFVDISPPESHLDDTNNSLVVCVKGSVHDK